MKKPCCSGCASGHSKCLGDDASSVAAPPTTQAFTVYQVKPWQLVAIGAAVWVLFFRKGR